jgi:hypothetical protein
MSTMNKAYDREGTCTLVSLVVRKYVTGRCFRRCTQTADFSLAVFTSHGGMSIPFSDTVLRLRRHVRTMLDTSLKL